MPTISYTRGIPSTSSSLLNAHPQPSIRTNHTPRAPTTLLSTQHPHHPRNLILIRRPTPVLRRIPYKLLAIDPLARPRQRRVPRPPTHHLLKGGIIRGIHIRGDGARVDGIHGAPLGKLAAPGARHGFQRRFRAAVDALMREAETRADAREVDDAPAAVVREVRFRRLHEEERAPDVDVVLAREFGGVDGGDAAVLRDPRVVDDDVDLELARLGVGEAVLGHVDDVGRTGLGAHVGLERDGFDGELVLKFGGEVGRFLRGRGRGVVHEDGAAFAG